MLKSYSKAAGPLDKLSPASVEFLPNELLLIIFNLIYDTERQPCDPTTLTCWMCTREMLATGGAEPHMIWRPRTDFLAKPHFPYALAAVCHRWLSILATVPKFWTRIVAFLHSKPQHRDPQTWHYLESQISWSRDLPFDVHFLSLISLEDASPSGVVRERECVEEVMAIIAPHMRRLLRLRFDTMYSSSLPSLRSDFRGEAPLLWRLELSCSEDNGVSTIVAADASEPHTFSCPTLMHLLIDGRNFMEICQDGAGCGWRDILRRLPTLYVVRLSSSPKYPKLSLQIALSILRRQSMPLLAQLSLKDVYLDTSRSTHPWVIVQLSALSIEMEQVDAEVAQKFARLAFCPEMHTAYYTKMHFTEPFPFPRCWSAVFEEVTSDITLDRLLHSWEGGCLDFIACPTLNDAFLQRLSLNVCSQLQELHVVDCIDFTVAEMKNMVQQRNTSLGDREPTLEDNNDPPVIVELSVNGRGPSLSPEDREWFKRKVALFLWDTTDLPLSISSP